jgi:elongation factor G
LGTQSEEKDIPDDLKDLADEYRTRLLEVVAEENDELMMKYLEGQELTEQEIKDSIRRATISTKIIPVICGSSIQKQRSSTFVGCCDDYLPSPVDIPPVEGVLPDTDEKLIDAFICR